MLKSARVFLHLTLNKTTSRRLGELKTLLTDQEYQNQYIECINKNRVSIITADTGSGKTMFTAMIFKKYNIPTIITQPRLINVFGVYEFIKNQYNMYVGYKTADNEKDTDNSTLIVTDGLLAAAGSKMLNNYKLLVIDECHEFNINMEEILYLALKRLKEDPNFKVIILSATLDNHIEKLKEYYKDFTVCHEHFAGKQYEIEEINSNNDLNIDIINSAKNGSVLVFMSSIAELYSKKNELLKINPNLDVQTLSSESDDETRKLVFDKDRNNVIWLATNVAQAGLTPANVNTVIITGFKYINTVDKYGNFQLKSTFISKEDYIQQKGRTGRINPGKCICNIRGRRNAIYTFNDLPDTTPVEIQRISIDSLYLRFLSRNVKLEDVKFVHELNIDEINNTKKRLIDAQLIENNSITQLGLEVSRLPLNPIIGKMVVIGKKYGLNKIMLILATILDYNKNIFKNYASLNNSEKQKSELLTAYNIILKILNNERINDPNKAILFNDLIKIKKAYQILTKAIKINDDKPTQKLAYVFTKYFQKYVFVKNGGLYINLLTRQYYRTDNESAPIIFGIPYSIENNNLIMYTMPLDIDIVLENMKEHIKIEQYATEQNSKIVLKTQYILENTIINEQITDEFNEECAKYLYNSYLYQYLSDFKKYMINLYNYSEGKEGIKESDWYEWIVKYILENNIKSVDDYKNNPIIFAIKHDFDKQNIKYMNNFNVRVFLKDLNEDLIEFENKTMEYQYNYSVYTKEEILKLRIDTENKRINKLISDKEDERIIILYDEYKKHTIQFEGVTLYSYIVYIVSNSIEVKLQYNRLEDYADNQTNNVKNKIEMLRRQELIDKKEKAMTKIEYDTAIFENLEELKYMCKEIEQDGFTFYLGYIAYDNGYKIRVYDDIEQLNKEWKYLERLIQRNEYYEKYYTYRPKIQEKIDKLWNVDKNEAKYLQSYYDRLGNDIYNLNIELNEHTFDILENYIREKGENDNNLYGANEIFRFTTDKRRR